MQPTQKVTHRISHNNLHILCQTFTDSEANTVLGLLNQFHKDCNRIFIDVSKIENTKPSVAKDFKLALSSSRITPEQVFFKGTGGFSLAINGNRVIVNKKKPENPPHEHTNEQTKEHVCCGRCAHCHCKKA